MTLSRSDYESYDATGLAELVRDGEISPRELVETAIDRIEVLNPLVNAVILKAYEQALDEVENRTDRPAFLGVPYLVKDLHAPVRGLPLTNGSRMFVDPPAPFDSTLIARLRAAGFVMLGRTNSPEFGLSASTEPHRYGATRNPWNTKHIAGGSSGGAGAAVASGMLPAAHATDSGGSIRIPASCNGLVGLKPTRGLNPYGPHRGDAAHGISHEHAVTRTVRDTAAILDITAGPDVGAPYFVRPPEGGFVAAIKRPPKRLRIGFWKKSLQDEPIHEECVIAVEKAARLLEGLGHRVEESRPDFDWSAVVHSQFNVLMTSLGPMVAMLERQRGRPLAEGELEPQTAAVVARGREASLEYYLGNLTRMQLEVRRMAAFFESFDVFLSPTMTMPPPLLGHLPTDDGDIDRFLAKLLALAPFAAPFNASGQPAINLPLHCSADGLPVGVHLAGRYGEDAALLALAAQMEQAQPWAHRRPQLG
ncbi:amidase [Mesorhizobium sp. 1B3]|uniref:amidase n=1 Tax=Mesorhizobium sp. 1B3 TaxID=3243599 RepID=UPI003D98722C